MSILRALDGEVTLSQSRRKIMCCHSRQYSQGRLTVRNLRLVVKLPGRRRVISLLLKKKLKFVGTCYYRSVHCNVMRICMRLQALTYTLWLPGLVRSFQVFLSGYKWFEGCSLNG